MQWMYHQSDSIQLKDIHNKFGTIPLKKFPITNILWHKESIFALHKKELRRCDR